MAKYIFRTHDGDELARELTPEQEQFLFFLEEHGMDVNGFEVIPIPYDSEFLPI